MISKTDRIGHVPHTIQYLYISTLFWCRSHSIPITYQSEDQTLDSHQSHRVPSNNPHSIQQSRVGTIEQGVTSQSKLFILFLICFLLSVISTKQLSLITLINSLTNCQSTLRPQLFKLCHCLGHNYIVYIFYYFSTYKRTLY